MDNHHFIVHRGANGVADQDFHFDPNYALQPAPQNAIILANSGMAIETSSSLCRNERGHFYCHGKAFSEADWANSVQSVKMESN